jgi:hypothetical protein
LKRMIVSDDEESNENEDEQEVDSPGARVLAFLRRNDPSKTRVAIVLGESTDEVELAEALQANNHVKEITLSLWGLANNNSNWELLLRVLATRETLERVFLWDDHGSAHRNPPERISPFLLAIQQNPRVQTVHLEYLKLYGDSMASFLDAATSITALKIHNCDLEAPGGAFAVAAALQRNTNIQWLELYELDDVNLILIVSSLGSNTGVEALNLWLPVRSRDSSLAVANLLESTGSIQRLELHGPCDLDTFRPIAQGLIQSRSVTELAFERWDFNGQDEVLILNSILTSKSNLQSLALVNCFVHYGRELFHDAIFNLLQPHSLLRTLELKFDWGGLPSSGYESSEELKILLRAVETSPLECFSIGQIQSSGTVLALIASIPRMQVQSLGLCLCAENEDMKRDIIQAVKQNASLRTVVANVYFNEDWLDNEDKRKLKTYSVRNKFLAEWIENPNTVPKAAWAEALVMAQTTGPDAVFRVLRVLTPSLGPFVGEQCRKRRNPDTLS